MLHIIRLGLVKYSEALEIMDAEHALLSADITRPEKLIVVNHFPVVTMGNRKLDSDLNQPIEMLSQLGIEYAKIDRGGSATVHEPGQLVLYPLVRLDGKTRTVRSFVCSLEQSMIDCCEIFGIKAQRDPLHPGVWVGPNKIGALGIRVTHRVTKHGLAFNITNSLKTFACIVPCGIRGKGVTSLELELKKYSSEKNPIFLELENCDLYQMVERILIENVVQSVWKSI